MLTKRSVVCRGLNPCAAPMWTTPRESTMGHEEQPKGNEMNWLSSNWIWLLLIGAMLWMHLGMHRGHGGHGGHSMSQQPPRSGHDDHGQDESPIDVESANAGSSHRHRGR